MVVEKKDYRRHYPVRFGTLTLRAELEKIAKRERRSLNEIINMACEEFVKRRAEATTEEGS